MSDSTLTVREEVARPNVGLMLQTIAEKGITEASVGVMAQLVSLQEKMEDRQAKKDFATDFVALQSDIPNVQAVKAVNNTDGTVRYMFAPFEEIMDQAKPMMQKYGFVVSFNSRADDKRVTSICCLMHKGGHFKENEFSCRVGKGPPGTSEAQGDGAAHTYAKRRALCDALNIVVGEIDADDARGESGPLDHDKVIELRERVAKSKANSAAFLKMAGDVPDFESIPANRYAELDEKLKKREIEKGLRDADGNWLF
jgi:hypothetical protein